MPFPRIAEARLRSLSGQFPALVVTGARQAGKTTLVEAAFPELHKVSLDLPSLAERAERDPGSFFREYAPPIAVDEVQYAPGMFRHVKAEIDRDRHAMGRFVLTGSQAFNLMKGVSDSLAGRCAILELENLAALELVRAGAIESAAASRLRLIGRGQFPELWRDPSISARDFYAAYLATYLERDVRQILNVTSLRDFERFLRALAARSGALLNKSEVAKEVGVSAKAIGDWLSVLQASGQIVLLEPWFANFGKRIAKSPKLYFRDSGLLCFLLGLDEDSLERSPFLGALWEGYVFAEMRKVEAALGRGTRFWFYRDQRGREVDFVLERGGELSFVEAKWSEHPEPGDARVIAALDRELRAAAIGWRPGRHYLLSTTASPFPIAEGIEAVSESAIEGMLT
jgi:predicted AAA+ superfamily ATPase